MVAGTGCGARDLLARALAVKTIVLVRPVVVPTAPRLETQWQTCLTRDGYSVRAVRSPRPLFEEDVAATRRVL